MFSLEVIKAMNGTTSEDQLHCEKCAKPMQVFSLVNDLRVCKDCKFIAEHFIVIHCSE